MLWGTRGVGKSSIVRQVALQHRVPLIDLRLTTIEPVAIRGAIYANEIKNKTVWFAPEFLPGLELPAEILFLDALTAAGHSGSQAVPRLVLVVDVSGSIADALVDRFARKVQALTRRLGAGLVLVVGDERVQSVSRFEPGRSDLRKLKFNGGGGTDFTPLLQEASSHSPDLVVVLTDLQGPALHRPACPVVWAVPEQFARSTPPFGRVLGLR